MSHPFLGAKCQVWRYNDIQANESTHFNSSFRAQHQRGKQHTTPPHLQQEGTEHATTSTQEGATLQGTSSDQTSTATPSGATPVDQGTSSDQQQGTTATQEGTSSDQQQGTTATPSAQQGAKVAFCEYTSIDTLIWCAIYSGFVMDSYKINKTLEILA